MRKRDWFCEECGADFCWLVWVGESRRLRKPKTEKDWLEAELFTNFCMDTHEFYPVGKMGVELDEKPCADCMKKIERRGK